MFQSFKRALRERATREALDFEFQKLGLDYRSFDPIIRSTMEIEAISSGDVRRQVESFLRVARMVDKYDLSDAQKKYAIMKAYERHAATLSGNLGNGSADSEAKPGAPVPNSPN